MAPRKKQFGYDLEFPKIAQSETAGIKENILATGQNLEVLSQQLDITIEGKHMALIQQYQDHLKFYQYISGQNGSLSTNIVWSHTVRHIHSTVNARASFYSICQHSASKLKEKDMQRRLRTYLKNNGRQIDIDVENVVNILELSDTISITDEFKSIWKNSLKIQDKVRFLDVIKERMPVLRTCKSAPPSQNRETSAIEKELEETLAEGITKMDEAASSNDWGQSSRAEAAIFVLGNSGSGKTTATQIMIGDLSHLHALYDQKSLVILDEAALISSSTVSKTLVPHYVLPSDTSEYGIWDCPGFNDNRGPEQDIAAMYFLKHALDTNKFGKFLFTIPHSSVKTGKDRSDFNIMATHAIRLIKKISQFSASIGLVITKVDNYRGDQYLSDQELMDQVVGFFTNYIQDQSALMADTLDSQSSEFKQRMEFVTGLLNNNTGVLHPRIAFIRTPDDCGPLNEFLEVQESRENVQNLFKDMLQYSAILPENFNISLGANTLYQVVNHHVPAVVEKTKNISCNLVQSTIEKFSELFFLSLTTEPLLSINFLKNADANFQAYLNSYNENNVITEYSFTNRLDVVLQGVGVGPISCFEKTVLKSLDSQLIFFREVSLKDTQLPSLNPHNMPCFAIFARYLSNRIEFFDFWNSTINQLKEHSNQNILHRLQNQKSITLDRNNVLDFVTTNNFIKGYSNRKDTWNKVKNEERDYYLDTVVQLLPSMEVRCENHATTIVLLITGRILLISEAFDKSLWQKICGSNLNAIKEVQIAASEIFYLDANIEETGKQLKLAIIAPTWHVISTMSQPKIYIVLNGARGKDADGYKTSRGLEKDKKEKGVHERYDPKPDGKPGRNGDDGERGGNAGFFYGLSQVVIGGENLVINVTGGDGGNGFDGETGETGEQGKEASYDDFPDASRPEFPRYMKEARHICNVGFKSDAVELGLGGHRWYSIQGQRSGRGGNGGKGGHAGLPGDNGSILMVTFGSKRDWTATPDNGKFGRPGKGGKGGEGIKHGKHISCKWYHASYGILVYFDGWGPCEHACIQSMDRSKAGLEGARGDFPNTTQSIVNTYTQYNIFRLYKNLTVGQFPKPTFLKNLETNLQIGSDILLTSFAEELQSLINLKLTNSPTLTLQQITSFVERLEYASLKHAFASQQKSAASEILSVALGQQMGLHRHSLQFNVVSTEKLLDVVLNRLPALKNAKADKIIQQINANFTNKFLALESETLTIIEKTVQPSIEQAQQQMQIIQQQLLAQLDGLLKDAKSDLLEKKKFKTKMEKAAVLNGVLGVLGIVGSTLSFLGPVGIAAGGLVTTGTSIAQSLAVNPSPPRVSFTIPPIVTNSMNAANKHIFEKEIRRIERITTAVEDANTQLGDQQLDKEVQLAGNVKKLASVAKNNLQTGNVPMFLKSKQTLDAAAKDLKLSTLDKAAKITKANQIEKRATNAIRSLVATMATVDGIANVVSSAQQANADISDINKSIAETEKQINAIENKKAEFYTEFIPVLDSMYSGLEAQTRNLTGYSQASLQVKGWQMKTVLQNMRQYVKSFANGLPAEESFELCFSALDEAITLLIRMYDHLEVLQDKKELADYIANVNMAGAINTGNRELDTAIRSMSHLVQANMFLDEYNITKQAFKQWVFPFAVHYLSERHVNSTTHASLDEILNIYTKEIEYLKEALSWYKASIVKTDEFLHFETFSSDAATTEPFFTWKNEQWKDSIGKLLSGKFIRLKSDPSVHHPNKTHFFKHKSAIKFQNIEMKLKATGNCQQKELDDKLRYFSMSRQHLGNSIYRVAGTDFIINDKAQTFRYSFEKNANGHVSRNGVQYKVSGKNNDFMMSPYTWWGVQITDPKPYDEIGFQDLQKFSECVDLELEGEGVYLNELDVTSEFLENLRLDEHYEVYNKHENINQASGGFIANTCNI